MKERPVPFSAAMVRALLAGTKTQTRRIMSDRHRYHFIEGHGDLALCPYGQPGERLWVREAWRTEAQYDAMPPREIDRVALVEYVADAPQLQILGRYRHARFMPRWASRITLEVTGVRVERLQDISEADAKAEGITDSWPEVECNSDRPFRDAYCWLWGQINGPGSWDANPWVWVVEFKRLEASHG